jgi:hypothetical protein
MTGDDRNYHQGCRGDAHCQYGDAYAAQRGSLFDGFIHDDLPFFAVACSFI